MWRMFESARVPGEQILAVSEGDFRPTRGGAFGLPTGEGEPGAVAVTDRAFLLWMDGRDDIARRSYWQTPAPRLRQYRLGLSQSMVYGLLPISDDVVFFIGSLGMPQPWVHAQQFAGHAERAWQYFHTTRRSRPPFAAGPPTELPIPALHVRIQTFLNAAEATWPGATPQVTPNGSGPLGPSYTFTMAGLAVQLGVRTFGEAGPAVVISAPVLQDVRIDGVSDDVLLRLASQPETIGGLLRLVNTGPRTDLFAVEVVPARALAAVDLAVAVHAVHRAALRGYAHRDALNGRPAGSGDAWTSGPDSSIPGAHWPDQLAAGTAQHLLGRLGSTMEMLGLDADPDVSGDSATIGNLVLWSRQLGPVPYVEIKILFTDPVPAACLPSGYGRYLMSHPVGPLDLHLYGNDAFDRDGDPSAGVWLVRHALLALYEGVPANLESAVTRLAQPDDRLTEVVNAFPKPDR